MIGLIKNEFIKIRKSKIIFYYIIFIITIVLMNKYSNKDIKELSFNIIPFIGIIVSVLFSGIICKEIESGSMRFYLTKPCKRYKVYLSKYIVILLCIIFSYLVITISVCLISGFDILYFEKFFIHLIPILFISSYIMCLTVIFKNHVFVCTISILTLCFSLIASQVLFGLSIKIIEYSFLPYLDYSIFNDELVLKNINSELGIGLTLKKGVIIDTIWSIVFLILGLKKFIKKDIKM